MKNIRTISPCDYASDGFSNKLQIRVVGQANTFVCKTSILCSEHKEFKMWRFNHQGVLGDVFY